MHGLFKPAKFEKAFDILEIQSELASDALEGNITYFSGRKSLYVETEFDSGNDNSDCNFGATINGFSTATATDDFILFSVPPGFILKPIPYVGPTAATAGAYWNALLKYFPSLVTLNYAGGAAWSIKVMVDAKTGDVKMDSAVTGTHTEVKIRIHENK